MAIAYDRLVSFSGLFCFQDTTATTLEAMVSE